MALAVPAVQALDYHPNNRAFKCIQLGCEQPEQPGHVVTTGQLQYSMLDAFTVNGGPLTQRSLALLTHHGSIPEVVLSGYVGKRIEIVIRETR